jgi:heptosyltransferase-1
MEKVLIVRLGAMGDITHGMPAVAALRNRFPSMQIAWLVERRWSELVASASVEVNGNKRSMVDTVLTADTFQWRKHPLAPSSQRDFRRMLASLRTPRFPVAVDLQGSVKSAVLMRLSGAKQRFGFSHPRERIATYFYQRKVDASKPHVIMQNLQLVSAAAEVELQPCRPELASSAEIQQQCDRDFPWSRHDPFVILVPDAGWKAKQWPSDRYARVASALLQRGFRVLVNTAPSQHALVKDMETTAGRELLRFQGPTPELIEMTRRARLLIGGDTGPMHLANLMGVPVVSIFGPTDPARNGPFFQPKVVLRSTGSQTSYSHSRKRDTGIESITVDEVLAAAERMLAV